MASNPPAIIDSRGFVIKKKVVSKELHDLIRNDLTVKSEANNTFGKPQYFKVYTEDDENYYLPKFWATDNIDIEPVIKLKYKTKYVANFKFNGVLENTQDRPQIEVIEAMLKIFYDEETNMLKPWASSIISIRTGGGKTVLGLFLTCFLNYNTVIFCHTASLFEQWIERINQYIPNAKIGWIQGDQIKIENCNIVIAMIQTVMTARKDYSKLLHRFNFAIYDECHHLGAKVFSSVMRQFQPAYSLGLSATVDRDDKLDRVFKWFLGQTGYVMEGTLNYDIGIQVYKFDIDHCENFRTIINRFTRKPSITEMNVNLTEIQERNNLIVQVIKNTFIQAPTRQMLVISHFTKHLFLLKEMLDETFPNDIGIYTGPIVKKLKLHPEKKVELENKKIILATYKVMSEAIDIKNLDTIFQVTNMKKVIQVCGRILRKAKEQYENQPLIMEIKDELDVFNGMHNSRMKQYKDKYLKPDGSWLEYYICNSDTNFEIMLERKADLSYLREGNKKLNKKTTKKVNTNKFYQDMFNSESDSD